MLFSTKVKDYFWNIKFNRIQTLKIKWINIENQSCFFNFDFSKIPQMKNQSFIFALFFIAVFNFSNAQSASKNNFSDQVLKDSIYNANKKKVLNYSMKDFDALFFEFFEKKANPNLILSKKEFYNYTVKIAAFSDRLASLYPAQKQMAAESKKKWLSENYEDYLTYKASQKK